MPFSDNHTIDARNHTASAAIVALLFGLLCQPLLTAQSPAHDRAFWQSIAKNKYAVPEHGSADALAHELSGLLASPDPELRDELAYSILTSWIYRRTLLSTPTLISLTDEWRENLKSGIGETGTNSVLKRSFCALMLSSIARREAKLSFMGAERFHQLVSEAVNYLQGERDLRGYDPKLHWIHATAHTADLLAALADSPLLTKEESAAILTAIDSRLKTATEIYTQGEQDRLAAAVVSVVRRADFNADAFAPWLANINDEDRDVWKGTTVEGLTQFQNHNYMLQALVVRLSLPPESRQLASFRQQVLEILAKRLD
jgi:hypothetical protein